MGQGSTQKTQEKQGTDITELMAAIAMLNNDAPPSNPVIVPNSIFPVSEQIKREEAEAAAAIIENAKPGDQMPDGTFYLGRFTSKDGTVKDWFAAAEDARDATGQKLLLSFNGAAKFAKESKAHDHNDWVVPTGSGDCEEEPDILGEVFNNKDRIGKEEIHKFNDIGTGFDSYYWSSSASNFGQGYARMQRFSDGIQGNDFGISCFSVRLVRSVAVKRDAYGTL